MNTKQRFDCNNVNNRLYFTLIPSLTGFSGFNSKIQIGMSDANSGQKMRFRLDINGDDTYGYHVQRGLRGQGGIVSGVQGSITSSITFVFEFNNYIIRIYEIFDGELFLLYGNFSSSLSAFPHHMNFRPTIDVGQSNLDPAYTCNIKSLVLIQDVMDDMCDDYRAFHQSLATRTYAASTQYAITGIRDDAAAFFDADIHSVYVNSYDFLITNAGANWYIQLIRNPTFAGGQTWTSQTNSPV